MRKRQSPHTMLRAALAALLIFSPATGHAKDRGFDGIVKAVESFYGVRHKRVPFMKLAGLGAKFGLKMAGLGQAKDALKNVKIALFEDGEFARRDSGSDSGGAEDLSDLIGRALDPGWQPLVLVRSAAAGERVYTYLKMERESVGLVVVTIGRRDAVVLQAETSTRTLVKWLERPEEMGRRVTDEANAEDQ